MNLELDREQEKNDPQLHKSNENSTTFVFRHMGHDFATYSTVQTASPL